MTSRLIFTGVLAVLFPIPTPAAEERSEIVEKTLEFVPGNTVSVHALDGGITVKTWDKNQVLVQAVKNAKADKMEKLDELLKTTVVDIQEKDSGIEVRTFRGKKPGLFKKPNIKVSYTLTTPRQANLILESVNGSILISPTRGNVIGKTEKGSIEASGTRGNVEARIKKDGDIRLSEISGSINANTSKGSIHIELLEQLQDDIRAEVKKGQLTLKIPSDSRARVKFTKNKGHIETEIPITVEGRIDKSVSGKINGGDGPEIHLKVDNGNINLTRL